MFGNGSTRRDYTYIEYILQGITKAMEKNYPYEIFNLGESNTISLKNLILLIGESLGIDPQIEELPFQPGDVEITFADISKAKGTD